MPERHFPKIRPVYFYLASAALFVVGSNSCYQGFDADIRAHAEADVLYENGTHYNSEHALKKLKEYEHVEHHVTGLIELSGSVGLVFVGRLFRKKKKILV